MHSGIKIVNLQSNSQVEQIIAKLMKEGMHIYVWIYILVLSIRISRTPNIINDTPVVPSSNFSLDKSEVWIIVALSSLKIHFR